MNGKYYWLKLKRDFFKRHDIRIVEDMQNGKDYILFYLKLLVESVDHDGALRFSDTIPYNEHMLATITNTNLDIVRSAMKIFIELGMIDLLDDGTIFMTETMNMIGTAVDNDNANRQRRFRERKKKELLCSVTKSNASVTESVTKDNESKSIEKEIEKDSDIDINKNSQFIPPTLEEVTAYCRERNNNVDPQAFIDHYTANGWTIGKSPMQDWKSAVRTWERSPQKRSYKTKWRTGAEAGIYHEEHSDPDPSNKTPEGIIPEDIINMFGDQTEDD